jgi:hypothetical protein
VEEKQAEHCALPVSVGFAPHADDSRTEVPSLVRNGMPNRRNEELCEIPSPISVRDPGSKTNGNGCMLLRNLFSGAQKSSYFRSNRWSETTIDDENIKRDTHTSIIKAPKLCAESLRSGRDVEQ